MSKDRGLKTRKNFNTTIDKNVREKLDAYAMETQIPMSRILDKAMTNYLNSVGLDSIKQA